MASFKINADYQVFVKILKTVNLKQNSLSFFRMEVLRLESFFSYMGQSIQEWTK